MILPSKHINLSESIIGLAGILLTYIKQKPYSLDDLWQEFTKNNQLQYHSFDNVLLAVNLLFLMGIVDINNTNGKIFII